MRCLIIFACLCLVHADNFNSAGALTQLDNDGQLAQAMTPNGLSAPNTMNPGMQMGYGQGMPPFVQQFGQSQFGGQSQLGQPPFYPPMYGGMNQGYGGMMSFADAPTQPEVTRRFFTRGIYNNPMLASPMMGSAMPALMGQPAFMGPVAMGPPIIGQPMLSPGYGSSPYFGSPYGQIDPFYNQRPFDSMNPVY